MKAFLKYLAAVLALVAVADLANRAVCTYIFKHLTAESEVSKEFKFATNNEQSDILMLGDSRASHHYNTQMIIDSLHATCYNAGYDGTGIVHSYMSFARALRNGRVQTVLCDLTPYQLEEHNNTVRLNSLYPYYWLDDSVHAALNRLLPWPKRLMLCSSFLQYNGFLHDVLRARGQKIDAVHGYVAIPASHQMKPAGFLLTVDDKPFRPSPPAERYLHEIIRQCQSRGIRIVLCQSPRLRSRTSFNNYLRTIATRHGIEYWEYVRMPAVMTPCYYQDHEHLNTTGADIFTREVIRRLALNKHK